MENICVLFTAIENYLQEKKFCIKTQTYCGILSRTNKVIQLFLIKLK